MATTSPLGAAEQVLRLHGSNTIGEKLAPELIEAWATVRGWQGGAWIESELDEHHRTFARGPDRLFVEIEAHGTGTGLAGLREGGADLWMASRPVKPEEAAASRLIGRLDTPAQEHVLALDGLAVIVHPSNPLQRLTVAQVRGLFAGRVSNWAEVGGAPGPVVLYARDDQSGTFDSFKSLVLGELRLQPGARRFESTSALSRAVARDLNGIGFVGIAGVGNARALMLSDVGTRALPPARFSVATEDYALSRRLFLYHSARVTREAVDFVEFTQSPPGQKVVESVGFVAQAIAPIALPARQDVGEEYAQLTEAARRLTVNFRFATGASYLDGKALRDLDRLAKFMRQEGIRRGELILIGFSDANEVNVYQAVAMSTDRADYVASELLRRGVAARRVRGVGPVAPVASNSTDSGRARNRRVEVWLRPKPEAESAFSAGSF